MLLRGLAGRRADVRPRAGVHRLVDGGVHAARRVRREGAGGFGAGVTHPHRRRRRRDDGRGRRDARAALPLGGIPVRASDNLEEFMRR